MIESIILATVLTSAQPQIAGWTGTQASPLSTPTEGAKVESIVEFNNNYYDAGFWMYRAFDQRGNVVEFQIDCK